jgi:divalent metal cation (Fe/Co/Zn/Cd) transporter
MLLVPKTYAEIVTGLDFLILITSLLFRKPKRRTVKSSLTRNCAKLRLLGYHLVVSAIALLVLNHYVFYTNLLDYFAGLLIDALIFYTGLKVVMVRE